MLSGVSKHMSIEVAFLSENLEANLALRSYTLLVRNQLMHLHG